MWKITISCFMLSVLTACAPAVNDFSKNYQAAKTVQNESSVQKCPVPKLVLAPPNAVLTQEQEKIMEQGYVLMGQSEWTSKKDESGEKAIEQGKKVGACLVLWNKKFVGTIHTKKRINKASPFRSGFFGDGSPVLSVPDPFNYEDVPVSYNYIRHTVLFFAKQK